MNLNEIDENRLIELIKSEEKLSKEYNYKLFVDNQVVFIFENKFF